MFKHAFQKLELSDVATYLDTLNPAFDGEIVFDPVETTILSVDLSFYEGYKFLEISNHSVSPSLQRHVVFSDGKNVVLNYTNVPIYDLNKTVPIVLNDDTVSDYVKFFFAYVKGKHGRFLISESVDDINWKEEPPPAARKAIGKMLKPIEILSFEGGIYHLEATMVFKDSLFKSDIYIDSHGTVTLKDEELLIEDMPVLDDVFGQ